MAKTGGARRLPGRGGSGRGANAQGQGRNAQVTNTHGRNTQGVNGRGSRDAEARGSSSRSAGTASPAPITEEPRTFRLGAIPGATPGRWIDTWNSRFPHVTLELVPLTVATQRAALDDLDAAFVRLPLVDEALHIIRLYDEVPVVVTSADSSLLAADELGPEDLVGEVLLTPLDNVLGPLDLPGTQTPRFPPLATTEEAIATVASGVGVVVVPQSLARLHHRKDADYRPLREAPTSTVALAWRRDHTTEDVDAFVGVIRGRTANSSR